MNAVVCYPNPPFRTETAINPTSGSSDNQQLRAETIQWNCPLPKGESLPKFIPPFLGQFNVGQKGIKICLFVSISGRCNFLQDDLRPLTQWHHSAFCIQCSFPHNFSDINLKSIFPINLHMQISMSECVYVGTRSKTEEGLIGGN